MKNSAAYIAAACLLLAVGSASAATPDAGAGQATFKQKCSGCHSDAPARNGVGPSLFGAYGRAAGSAPGYAYSKPLKASGIIWTPETLTAWLTKPTAVVPGTKMGFVPPTSAADKANLIAYLKTRK